jgi:DNA-binding MurR/RpiR family transcriptional regulator
MPVAQVVAQQREKLSPAERRVGDLVLSQPECVAFGTVAEVARRAGTSGATVVRLADRLGFDGYRGLQAMVQADLAALLRPAAERIRENYDFVIINLLI